ncbi:Vacuolar morphogenesis protein 6 [Elasticomyces elasticus]|uniref:Vacuolar morphogenesis protein 6 n=1 Tax=Exophiala sideris TaxID=1016849 RepID=A0ABR0JKP7_9EURO|nr:Vacuolar morphogenesis protein 6 [Elasticomyces elasticus]KAK5030238.1 Vacuolar morphogenesis protein 6 [Exophiala sideris]KAK5035106.1 Vacuolar morphogenesis protein 6 [Exophiala sideris]KAK5066029.1 Vacuolar morphogenesis protein 6 [Exophiala sideris]KAK5178303.1 Vacuolar morphogenesis protein 6 [Eurotiomycetes sp. CCFEE 6388]
MLSAFTAQPIVELKQRDKSKIESILSHSDQLLVGLNTGSLRIYRVKAPSSRPTDGEEPDGDAAIADASATNTKPSELLREYEKFSKYKIEQLAVFREANILISLSNGLVSIHDLGTYELQEQLTNTKGASVFAATSNIVKDSTTGVPTLVSRLAVGVKRRLLLWSWHDGELSGNAVEIALSHSIKSLTWATGTKILAGLSTHYVLVDTDSQDVKSIVGPGSIGGAPGQEPSRLGGTMSYIGMGSMVPTPLATGLGEDEMLLARDINTHFIDRGGEPIGRRQVPWRSPPQAVGYSYPFLLALQEPTKGSLEVRNPKTLTLLQSIDLPGAVLLQVPNPNISLAHQGKGFLVASERIIWRMQGLNYDAQIDTLVESGSLDEAISLLEMIEETLIKDKAGRLREIKMQKAQKLFDEKKFRDALDLFSEVSAPPERVIRLYPAIIAGDLALEDHKDSEESAQPSAGSDASATTETKPEVAASHTQKAKAAPSDVDTASIKGVEIAENTTEQGLSDKELKMAVRELQAFLADVRRRLQRFFNPDQTVRTLSEVQNGAQSEDIRQITEFLLGLPTLEQVDLAEKLREVARLVDTTLFRAHMYATPSLAGSLFRISNFCDPDVVMAKLEETERYNDLIEFLYGKRLHRQALERLQKFGKAEHTEDVDPQLHGPARTVSYLQNLGPELIDMILEFARWPLEADPHMAMEIFMADTENAESLPRHKVLEFLESIDKDLALRYLEHVVDELNDTTPDLHQRLLTLYLEHLQETTSPTHQQEHLDKLLTLLRTSEQYSPAKTLGLLPRDDPVFYEPRAIVFSKMGNHKQALEIYVFKLQNPARAEEYCNQTHLEEAINDTSKPSSRRRSTSTTDPVDEQPSIYQILLNLYLNPPKGEKAMWGPAIELMARHGPRLPATSTLELVPEDLLVKELEFYFRGRIRNANSIMNDSMVTSGLRKVDAVRIQAALLLGEGAKTGGRGRKVRIDEDRVCGVCYKRLGGSVISVFPDNSVVHLGCAARKQTDIEGRSRS